MHFISTCVLWALNPWPCIRAFIAPCRPVDLQWPETVHVYFIFLKCCASRFDVFIWQIGQTKHFSEMCGFTLFVASIIDKNKIECKIELHDRKETFFFFYGWCISLIQLPLVGVVIQYVKVIVHPKIVIYSLLCPFSLIRFPFIFRTQMLFLIFFNHFCWSL